MTGADLADVMLSLAAFAGVVVLSATIRARDAHDPLNRRFLFGLAVTAVLFGARAGLVLTGWGLFGTVTRIAAALIPIAVLILTEGLLRRHAPGWAKAVVGGGTVLAIGLALWPSAPGIDPEDIGLMAIQIAGFVIAGWLVARRDRDSLSAAENRAVVRLGLSLILFVPLAAADFLAPWLGLPVRVAGLAVLVLCWLAVSLGRVEAGTLRHLTVIAGAAVVATLAIVAAGGGDPVLVGAVILAALFIVAIVTDALSLGAEEQSLSLLQHMAEGPDGQVAFLRGLLAHPMVEGAAIIEGEALRDFDPALLGGAFRHGPLLRRGAGHAEAATAEQLDLLFDRYAATHLICLSARPLRLVVLAMPALAASPRAELELAAIARMARLMEGRDDGR